MDLFQDFGSEVLFFVFLQNGCDVLSYYFFRSGRVEFGERFMVFVHVFVFMIVMMFMIMVVTAAAIVFVCHKL